MHHMLRAGTERSVGRLRKDTTSVKLDPHDSLQLQRIASRWRRPISEILRSNIRALINSVNLSSPGKPEAPNAEVISVLEHSLQDVRRFYLDGQLDGPEKDHLTDHASDLLSAVRKRA